MATVTDETTTTITLLQRALKRERIARQEAETLLEDKAREVYYANEQLKQQLEERKQLQCQLIHVQKMESLGQLAAGVAHEINNPISFVMSNLSTLSEYFDSFKAMLLLSQNYVHVLNDTTTKKDAAFSAFQEEFNALWQQEDFDFLLTDVGLITSESMEGLQRVKDIVQNLKTFARADEAENKAVNLNECLESTLKLVWNELKYKCTVVKNYGELPLLLCCPGQLNQVFMNLFVNAAQAMDHRGTITISSWAEPEHVVIQVSDTGNGIPEANMDKIFDPFFTTKSVGQGTGLGLSISYRIIQQHAGTITVDSVEGQGSTFTIYLPRKGHEYEDPPADG